MDAASEWDTEEGEENAEDVGDDEIENIDMEEIKLRRPKARSKIADLTNIIEAQLVNHTKYLASEVLEVRTFYSSLTDTSLFHCQKAGVWWNF